MEFYDEYILVDHIESALRNCENVIKRGEKWNFRCNICGDSKKSKTKRRGWILKNKKNIWIFNCFNDCGSMGALSWLKKYFPDEYKNYIVEILSKNKIKKVIQPPQPIKQEPVKRKNVYPFLHINLEKNSELTIIKDAIEFCKKRKFPEEIWIKFLVCDEGKYRGRLIIPFYNKEGKIYYFQARTLNENGEKYISMEGEKKIYNIYNVDKTKPVMITEGMFDSMFLENSVAIAGLRMSEHIEKQLKEFKCYFLLDYDKPGQNKSLELLKEGYNVFNWYKFQKDYHIPKRDKWDINDTILYLNREVKFTFKELEKYFTNNFFDSIYFG